MYDYIMLYVRLSSYFTKGDNMAKARKDNRGRALLKVKANEKMDDMFTVTRILLEKENVYMRKILSSCETKRTS